MTSSQLDIIDYDERKCEEKCKKMFRKWLTFDCSATWGKLIDAIHSLDETGGMV